MSDEPLLNIKSTCHGCGLTISQPGDDAAQIMRQVEAAHDCLRPECPESLRRSGGADPKETRP